jgi:tetratricopeptide (TPR) repeat protein
MFSPETQSAQSDAELWANGLSPFSLCAFRRPLLLGVYLLFLSTLVLASGCATTPKQPKVQLTGDIMVDGPNMIANGPAKDKILWQYRTAAAAMRRGQFDVAKPMFDDALMTLQGIYGKDAEARKSRGYFNKESRKTFIGEPYERSMAYFYRGLIYWMDGELDNARACFKSAEFEDSDADNKEYAGDWVLPDYLDGLATTKLGGDGSDALKRARAEAKNVNLPDYQPNANVLFIIEFGPGPVKYASGEYGQELRFRTRPSPVFSARIKTDSIDLPVAPTDDVNFQATTRGGRVMDHVLGNKAVFKSTTDTAGNVGVISGAVLAGSNNNTTRNVGLGLLLAGLISKGISASTTPEADTRTWDNLPQFISFAAIDLPPGDHVVTVEFLDRSGRPVVNLTKTLNVNITTTDRDKLIFVSDSSTTPQSL